MDHHTEPSESELAELLNRIELGDQGAFKQLFHKYHGRLANFLRPKLRGVNEDIHSVANETLYEIWRKPRKYDGRSKFLTYLIGIAKNKLHQHWADKDPNLVSADGMDENDEGDSFSNIPGETGTPLDGVLQREQMSVLLECAEKKLNPLQRTVILDRLLYGYRIEEIAEATARKAATLRRAFQIGYGKILDCVRIQLGLGLKGETS